ncbi:MAG: hypothetical protein ACQESC_02030 [Nanobdellota archaeon]
MASIVKVLHQSYTEDNFTLSPEGRVSAFQKGIDLARQYPDSHIAFYSSDNPIAQETAQLLSEGVGESASSFSSDYVDLFLELDVEKSLLNKIRSSVGGTVLEKSLNSGSSWVRDKILLASIFMRHASLFSNNMLTVGVSEDPIVSGLAYGVFQQENILKTPTPALSGVSYDREAGLFKADYLTEQKEIGLDLVSLLEKQYTVSSSYTTFK